MRQFLELNGFFFSLTLLLWHKSLHVCMPSASPFDSLSLSLSPGGCVFGESKLIPEHFIVYIFYCHACAVLCVIYTLK